MPDVHLTGIHHLAFPVSDLGASIAWYERCLAAARITRFDHHDPDGVVVAVILALPGGPLLELRSDPATAGAVSGYLPVAFGVSDRVDLDRWIAHLDAQGVEHSEVATRRVGYTVDITSPDGLRLRLYTDPVDGFDAVEFVET